MKLKLSGSDFQKRPLTVMVKAPRKYIETVSYGEVIDVEDQLGFAILNQYPNAFEQCDDADLPPPQPKPGTLGRVTKPAGPPPRTTMAPDAAQPAGGK